MSARPFRPGFVTILLGLAATGCGDPVLVLGDAPGIMRRVAGVPDSAGIGVGETALTSRLSEPRAIAVDGAGTVFVASFAGRAVQRFMPGGDLEVVAGTASCVAELCLDRPVGLAPDGLGGIYVSDQANDAIFRLDPADGSLALVAGNGERGVSVDGSPAAGSQIAAPTGLALDGSGRLYFAESAAGLVRRIESDGTLATVAGSGVRGSDGDGGPATEASLGSPSGLALGGGVLYVADVAEHRVRGVDLETGTIDAVAGSGDAGFGGDGGTATAALLDSPHELALGPNGTALFIADSGNDRVRRVLLGAGTITTFAGNGADAFAGELLPAGDTPLAGPRGLAVTSEGRLFIADTDRHIIWRTTIER